MNLSTFDVFKVGVGPSSSHTMGPMLAARFFVRDLEAKGVLERATEVFVQLYGSLALTGLGHCTDRAILLGLEGHDPSEFDPAVMEPTLARIRGTMRIRLAGRHEIAFDEPMNLLFHRTEILPAHSNGLRFTARDAAGATLLTKTYSDRRRRRAARGRTDARVGLPPRDRRFRCRSRDGAELLAQCERAGLSVSELTLRNEARVSPDAETRAARCASGTSMQACVRARLPQRRHAARRAQGAAARAEAFRELTPRRRSRVPWTRWIG